MKSNSLVIPRSPSLVILSGAKDLLLQALRVNSATRDLLFSTPYFPIPRSLTPAVILRSVAVLSGAKELLLVKQMPRNARHRLRTCSCRSG